MGTLILGIIIGFLIGYLVTREAKQNIFKFPGIEPSPDKVRELEEKINKQSKQVEKLLKIVVEMAKKPTPTPAPKPTPAPEPTTTKVEAKQGQASEAGTSQVPAKS